MLQAQLEIEYDPIKNERNIATRGISFEMAHEFDFHGAFIFRDKRKDYGETRLLAYGFIESRLYSLCFKPIRRGLIRVISFRKANLREVKYYENNK